MQTISRMASRCRYGTAIFEIKSEGKEEFIESSNFQIHGYFGSYRKTINILYGKENKYHLYK